MKTPPLQTQAITNSNPDSSGKQPESHDFGASAEKRHERRMFIFLTVFLAPILSVALVGAYGLIIWLYQMLAGPPSS